MELCHLGSAPNSQGHSGTVTSHFTLSLSIFFFQMVSMVQSRCSRWGESATLTGPDPGSTPSFCEPTPTVALGL